MIYTPEIASAMRAVRKPFKEATVQVGVFESKIALIPSPSKKSEDFSPQEKLMYHKYLFQLQDVVESFGVTCHVWGFDGVKG